VNGILLHHNIEKQMSDSRGEVAYLMADISEVKEGEIRDLYQSLEELSCTYYRIPLCYILIPNRSALCYELVTNEHSVYPHTGAVLGGQPHSGSREGRNDASRDA
jgi:hypothetical protein